MIDWSDLGQGRNGPFAAVCFRGRGLPLLSWVSTPQELDPSQNRVEEFFIGRLLRHLPTNIRPLLLADRGFGRASLIRLVQQMPHHTGYLVDYVIRLKGVPVSSTSPYQVPDRLWWCSAPTIAVDCGTIPCVKAGSTSGRKPFAAPTAPWSSI